MNSPARSYLPGQPAFERLVQHWVDHHSHRVIDEKPHSFAFAVEQAEDWCETIPGCKFVSAAYMPEQTAFQGTLQIRVTAGTGVDKFEKLLSATVAKTGHGTIEIARGTKGIVREVRIGDLIPPFGSLVTSAVEEDREVARSAIIISVACARLWGRSRMIRTGRRPLSIPISAPNSNRISAPASKPKSSP